jgi:YVTN family beta-propeller protein
VGSVTVGENPNGVAYDGAKGEVFVANSLSNNVSVISDASDAIVATVAVGVTPYAVAYDEGKRELFVTSTGLDAVDVVSDINNTIEASVLVGNYPTGVACDGAAGEVFVANDVSGPFYEDDGPGTVSVVSDTNDTVVATVGVGDTPLGEVYDSGKGEIFVVNYFSYTVSVISAKNNTVVATVRVGIAPQALAYDSGKGEVFVANTDSDNVSVISDTSNTVVATVAVGSDPVGVAYDSGRGEVFVANAVSNTVSVISDTSDRVVATVHVGPGPGGVAFDDAGAEVFVANGGSDTVSVISDANDTVVATVAVGVGPSFMAYDSGTGEVYVVNYVSGTLSILSAGSVSVVYPVTFTESGLPAGTSWSVTFDGVTNHSTGNGVGFLAPNGSYSYTVGPASDYAASPASGSVTVDGANATVLIGFAIRTESYAVTFEESGLASGSNWFVTLNGTTRNSSSAELGFTEPNGTYGYTIALVAGYSIGGSRTGNVTVNGNGLNVQVRFLSVAGGLVPLTFEAIGLPDGSNWSVTLTAISSGLTIQLLSTLTRWSNGAATVLFEVSKGTYSYTGSTLPNPGYGGYSAGPSSVDVSGAGATVTLAFQPGSGMPDHSTPLGWGWAVGLTLLLIGVVGLAVTTYRHEQRGRARGRVLMTRISETDWMPDERGNPTFRRTR